MDYLADFLYGATKYPCALFRPSVFFGYFTQSKHGEIQKELYKHLRSIGFQRTVWQLVFPGQVAGLIKRISRTALGMNEYHIRFYRDGTIECELEVDRWSTRHWTGPRHYRQAGEALLRNIINEELSEISQALKDGAGTLVGSKGFTEMCVRSKASV